MAVQSPKDILLFTGVMDGDTEARYIRDGNYIKLLNGRTGITNNGVNGSVEDTEGNLLVFNQYLTLGTNKVVGSYEDVKDKSVIYFVYNSLGYHGIFRWYQESPGNPQGEIQKIWQVENPSIYDTYNKNPLNFDPDYLITGIALVDNLLNWNCYNDQPKQMDIVKANETRKKRVFDLYFNKFSLGQNVQHDFTLYDPNGSVFSTFSVTDNSAILQNKANNLTSAINQAPNLGFFAIDKEYYIELHCLYDGRYNIAYSDNYNDTSRNLPNNFYYNDVPGNFFYRIQMPPTCSPNAYYIPSNQQNLSNEYLAFYNGDSGGFSNNKNTYWNYIGIGSDQNDSGNYIITGTAYSVGYDPYFNALSPVEPYYSGVGYFFRPQGNFDFVLKLDLSVIQATNASGFPLGGPVASGGGFPIISVYLKGYDSTNNEVFSSRLFRTLFNTQNGVSAPKSYKITKPFEGFYFQNNIRYFLVVENYRCDWAVSNALARFGSTELSESNVSIEKQTACFRAKYIYENNQNSVYGQATSIILRTQNYIIQKQLQIDFNDKIIQNDYYATRLKNIALSVTYDNGTTWYDFALIEKYQFVCALNAFYIYSFNEPLNVVSPEEAQQQFHAVPLRAKSLEYADNRLIDGGLIEGYDNYPVKYTVELVPEDVLGVSTFHYTTFDDTTINNPNFSPSNYLIDNPVSIQGFRFGYQGRIGIVYYDEFDRKTGVLLGENPDIFIPQINEYASTIDTIGFFYPMDYIINKIRVNIYNAPPSWATKYRLVRTKDLSQSSYLVWCIDRIETLDQSGSVSSVGIKYWKIYVTNIGYYTNQAQRGSVIEYTFEKGDRVKILFHNYITSSVEYPAPVLLNYDYDILESGPDYFLINYDPGNIYIKDGTIIEIYSKGEGNVVVNPLYYEMSECYEIKTVDVNGVKKKIHCGNDNSQGNQDQAIGPYGITQPARCLTDKGGAYFRFRNMYWNTTTAAIGRRMWISSDYADEFIQSKFDGIFRPNAVIQNQTTDLPTSIRISDQYLSGTKINGISSYNALNITRFSTEYGLLAKLKLIDNDVVKATFENSFQLSIYIKQGVLQQAQGSSALLSVTDNVVSNSHIIQRTLGTQNPESVALNDEGDCFGYDENKGVVWRSSGNGLIQVSDYYQKTNFKNWSNQRNIYNKIKSQTPSVYDIYHDEYIITLGKIDEVLFVPPMVVIDIVPPRSNGMTIEITIEETGQVICPTTFISGTIQNDLQNTIINKFAQIGASGYIDAQGNTVILAPNISFANQNIIINVFYNDALYGPNLLENNYFNYPLKYSKYDAWEIDYTMFSNQNYGGDANYYVAADLTSQLAFDKIPKLYSAISTWGSTPNIGPPGEQYKFYCIQRNLPLKTGKSYQVTIDCENPIQQIGIGNLLSNTYSSVGASARQTFIFQLTFVDDPKDYGIFYLGFGNNNSANRYVWSVELKEILDQSFNLRYRFDSGQAPEPSAPFEPLTISFNKQKNGWTHYYSFTPEYYGKINDNIVSFKDGDLYIHTPNAIPKNYYGVQYPRELTFVSNKDFPKVKVFKELMVNGLGSNSAPKLTIPPYEGVFTGMESELTTAHFSVKEGMQYAAIQRDKLTPGFSTTDLAWLNGRSMRGQYIIVTLSNTQPVQSLIYSTEILYFYSENS